MKEKFGNLHVGVNVQPTGKWFHVKLTKTHSRILSDAQTWPEGKNTTALFIIAIYSSKGQEIWGAQSFFQRLIYPDSYPLSQRNPSSEILMFVGKSLMIQSWGSNHGIWWWWWWLMIYVWIWWWLIFPFFFVGLSPRFWPRPLWSWWGGISGNLSAWSGGLRQVDQVDRWD